MAQDESDRKRRFRVALALVGTTQDQWAIDNGVTGGHVSQVLGSGRPSRKLCNRIDAFVAETFKAHKVRAA